MSDAPLPDQVASIHIGVPVERVVTSFRVYVRPGNSGGPAVNDERYVEIWNLVFMQYVRGEGTGKHDFEILGELPSKNIDTGLGLERLAMILQGVQNMYEIDTSMAVINKATELTGGVTEDIKADGQASDNVKSNDL